MFMEPLSAWFVALIADGINIVSEKIEEEEIKTKKDPNSAKILI